MRNVLKYFIYFYQALPLMRGRCRFYPSCSHYAKEAIQKFGVWRGGILTISRILRCHPWGECGIDLVPNHYTKHKNK